MSYRDGWSWNDGSVSWCGCMVFVGMGIAFFAMMFIGLYNLAAG